MILQMLDLVDRPIWLTSFWGFSPGTWGCVGFSDEWRRNKFLPDARKDALVVIYVTKGKGPENQRGKVVGILETTGETGHVRNYISGDEWAKKDADPERRGKWEYAVKVSRAWIIDEAEWNDVDDIFAETYGGNSAELIGANGVRLTDAEAARLANLTVHEVPVYGQTDKLDSVVRPFADALKPSRAVIPAKEPYFVGEVDGPKHLYILRLVGGVSNWLGEAVDDEDGKMIIKVGFSKSPYKRRDQIQSSYPDGRFKWEILGPDPVPYDAHYPNAAVAIKGEDKMKARLFNSGARVLGGEFYLAEEWLVRKCWFAGKLAAEEAAKKVL